MLKIKEEKCTTVKFEKINKKIIGLLDLNNSSTIQIELPKSILEAKFIFKVRTKN